MRDRVSCKSCGRSCSSHVCQSCVEFFKDVVGKNWKRAIGVKNRVIRYSVDIDGDVNIVYLRNER